MSICRIYSTNKSYLRQFTSIKIKVAIKTCKDLNIDITYHTFQFIA